MKKKCRKKNITMSDTKFEIAKTLKFAGFMISEDDISPDPVRTKAIRSFPRPGNIHDVRSFLGLANTLTNFVPDLVQATAEMRKLTQPSNAFLWLDEHELEFQKAKEILNDDMHVKPFHSDWETLLFTDASRLYGMGFVLMQTEPVTQKRHLVTCGSKSLTETQQRYATIELECLAILVAVRKCDFYLRGLPSFEVITDHRPLLGVFKNDIFKLDNARLMRIREKLIPFNFTLAWIEGK